MRHFVIVAALVFTNSVWSVWSKLHHPPTESSYLLDCDGKAADVVFVLDTSNSIWIRDFRHQLNFVKDVIRHFPVDNGIVKVGLMTFADRPVLRFGPNQYNRKSAILNAVGSTRYIGGYGTRTADALRFLREVALAPERGNRTNVTRVGIVVTDGQSDRPSETAREANNTKQAGIHLFVIGVGAERDADELKAIASHPPSFYEILTDSYSGLDNIRELLAIKTCAVTDPTTISTTADTSTSAHVISSELFGKSAKSTTIPSTLNAKYVDVLRDHVDQDSNYSGIRLSTTGQLLNEVSEFRFVERNDNFSSLENRRHPLQFENNNTGWINDSTNNFEATRKVSKETYDLSPVNPSPGFWRSGQDGRMTLLTERFYTGQQGPPPSIANGSTIEDDGNTVWSVRPNGQRQEVGKVINGSKFIGQWLTTNEVESGVIWWGYIINDTVAKDNAVDPIDRIGNGTGAFNHGFWLADGAGTTTWYQFISPGVFSAARRETSSVTAAKEAGKDIDFDGSTEWRTSRHGHSSLNSSLNEGCRVYKPTEVVFVLNSKSKQENAERHLWSLARAIVSEIDMDNSPALRIRFVHECSAASRLDQGLYSTKQEILKAVDDTIQTFTSPSTHLIETMIGLLNRSRRVNNDEQQRHRKVGIYITDGKSESFDKILAVSDKAKYENSVEMFTVGLCNGVSPTELQVVASCPVEKHSYVCRKESSENFIDDVSRKISQQLCF